MAASSLPSWSSCWRKWKKPGPRRRLCLDVDAVLSVRMKRQACAEERLLAEITQELWSEYLRQYAEE